MRQLFACVVLFAAVVACNEAGNFNALAQGTKKEVKKTTTGSAKGVIEIGEGKDGKFRFFVRDEDGKLVAMSSPGGYATVKDAQAAIDELKEIVSTAKVSMAKKKADDGKKKVEDTKKKTDNN